jgi:hypothetical protein
VCCVEENKEVASCFEGDFMKTGPKQKWSEKGKEYARRDYQAGSLASSLRRPNLHPPFTQDSELKTQNS